MHHLRSPATAFRVASLAGLLTGAAVAADHEAPRLIRQFCGECHCDGAEEGGISLGPLLERIEAGNATPDPRSPDHATWLAVWRNLRVESMPPADQPRPAPEQRHGMLQFVLRDVLGVEELATALVREAYGGERKRVPPLGTVSFTCGEGSGGERKRVRCSTVSCSSTPAPVAVAAVPAAANST